MAIRARPPRFYCSQLPHPRLSDRYCMLDADETHHARKVLRLEVGEPVELFDGRGGLAHATIEDYDGSTALCHVTAVETMPPRTPVVTVATAVPKGPRAEAMVDQLSQAGADRVIPLRTQRSVVDPRAAKLEKFERHAIESAKQSGRLHFMTIAPVAEFADMMREPRDLGLIATPGDLVDRAWESKLSDAQRLLLLIGPEGGWSPEELRAADAAGFLAWTFSPNVMRIEAAAAAAVALLRYLSVKTLH